ncbi:MAG: type II toxin-antitoxin system Phd/YefM family antitoxin [Chloroflexota bacterium]
MAFITITDLARNFSEYINRVFYRGEQFTITRGKQPIAQISPLPRAKKLKDLVLVLDALPALSKSEADDFEKDLAQIRAEINRKDVEDPWASS